MKKKLRSRRGFTMTEALVALAVLVLLCTALGSVMPAMLRAFEDSTKKSEANLLCSTLVDAVSNELRFAEDVVKEGGTITFTSRSYGTGVSVSDAEGRVAIGGFPLLGEKAYTSRLNAAVTTDYESGVFTATVTIKDSGNKKIAEQTFSVAAVNE